jgi:hypothetical protein
MKKCAYFAVIVLIVLTGFIFQLSHIQEPLTGDASYFISLAREMSGVQDYPYLDLERGIGIWHPMLYQSILALIGRLFGPELLYFRIFGVLIYVVNTVLVGIITSRVSRDSFFSAIPALACALFALNPLAVSLGIHIDIDNSILTTAMLLFLLTFVSTDKTAPGRRIVLLSACFALALFCKLTTPLLLIGALFIYFACIGNYRDACLYCLGVLSIGAAMFMIGWLAMTQLSDYPFFSVFARIFHVFLEKMSASSGMMEGARFALSVVYFVTAPLLLVFAYITVRVALERKRHEEEPIIYIAIVGSLILIGYLFIGGLTYGVTKYQYPAVPMLAVVCACGLKRYMGLPVGNKYLMSIFGLLAASLAACLLVGDPILHLNYDYKYYLFIHRISGGFSDGFFTTILRDVSVYVLIPFAFFVGLAFLKRKSKAFSILLFFLVLNGIVFSLALYAQRITADYAVLYAYGGRGTREVWDMLAPGSRVFIGEGLICPPRITKAIEFVSPKRPDLSGDVIGSIEKTSPDYIVTGITIDTLSALDTVYGSDAFLGYVKGRYRRVEIGSYTVWVREGR